MSRPPVDADRLRALLGVGWGQVAVVAETTSTNADLIAAPELPERSVLVAEHQVAGRGRLARSWESPPGAGLTFSVLLRPAPPIATWGWLSLLAGVALLDAIRAVATVEGSLKWPNDLMLDAPVGGTPRKAAGILAQTKGDAVVLGVGLNVSTTAAELPVPTATSLALAGAASIDRTDLLAEILHRLAVRYAHWSDADGEAEACGLAVDYRAACATIGQQVTVTPTDGAALGGKAVGIDSAGRLLLEVDGTLRAVGAGDVHHLRPADPSQ